MKLRSIAIMLICLALLAGAALAVEVETVTVSTQNTVNRPPVAENLSISTYRNVSVGGSFQAVDPEGDLLSFRVTLSPGKGSVTVRDDGFVYTPQSGRRGKDSFRYQAVDSEGNASAEAVVSIRIEKQAGPVFYPELDGSALQYAAVRLAEEGIFTGEKVSACWCFSADTPLSRADFLTMCAALTGMEPLADVRSTGFYDDDTISAWQKPYVSAALLYGVVQGSAGESGRVVFRGDQPITRAEAAVMLNSFLEITDAAGFYYTEDVPAWAAQAVANLRACDICSGGDFQAARALTRGDAAGMLSAAADVLAARGKNSRFRWSE